MGIPLERFLGHVDDSFLCNICQGVFISPVVTDCGHTFCAKCLEGWISASCPMPKSSCPEDNYCKRQSLRCPTCRHKLSQTGDREYDEKSIINVVSRPVLALRNFINGLLTHCEHSSRGCTFVGPVEVMHSGQHHVNCAYAPVDCAGCGHTVNQMELAEHQLHCFGIKAELSDLRDDDFPCNLQGKTHVTTQTEERDTHSACSKNPTPLSKSTQTSRNRARSHSPSKSYRMEADSENTSLHMLRLSLIKLVCALEIELNTAQAELHLKKVLRSTTQDRGL
ncbi:E3 ubiquitin-protein ligase PDZRN3-B [Clonorchis sinensis]|uniref:E3 ubiquitin-protein ligase PDZRN3-B n=1 Tax=Clonorchis sinensis TaxID=79923 RepID=A0A419Q8D2_CLOSI|nr:E3 ubiquitin-protein ligase PDZRN3-B [Clonorchis sinensis]